MRWAISADPEDGAITSTVTKILMQMQHFRGDSAFSTWVERIARRDGYTEKRESQKQPFQLFEPEEGLFTKALQSSDAADGGVLVEQVFADLSAEEQTLLAGKMESYSDAQIAELLKITANAVKLRWQHLRDRIRHQITVSTVQRIGSGNATEDLGR